MIKRANKNVMTDGVNVHGNHLQGDSGGPLACEDESGVWTVIGVTSFGNKLCSSSFSARVPTFVDWIQQTIADNRV